MPSDWLASRHLRNSSAGRQALTRLAALAKKDRERILSRGDELARSSVTLAHSYFLAAVSACDSLGSSFAEWDAQGATLLDTKGSRSAARHYLALPPHRLFAVKPAARHAWTSAIIVLGKESSRLAGAFAQTIGNALCACPSASSERVVVWQRATLAALHEAGWRGEFLAVALIDTAKPLFPLLAPRAVALWGQVFTRIGSAGRTPRLPPAAKNLAKLNGRQQQRVLSLCSQWASRDPDSARRWLTAAPAALEAVPAGPAASGLLTAIEQAAGQPGLIETVELLPALVHGSDNDTLELLIKLAVRVAEAFVAGLPPYLRTMVRAYEQGDRRGVSLWVEHGISSGRVNRMAGLAHFRLETRTAHRILVRHSAAVAFEEVEQVMQRYLRMMARRPLHLATAPGIWFRPLLEAPEDTALHLPERIGLSPSYEENQLFYKLTVAHMAGRWEYGTYRLEPSRLAASGWPLPAAALERDDVIGLVDAFPNPLLASMLFVLLDGSRIDAALERDFPGLAVDLDRLGRLYASTARPAAAECGGELFLEALFLMSVGRSNIDELPPRLQPFGASVEPLLLRLRSPDATVYDSARLLISCYGFLTRAADRSEVEDSDPAATAQVGGATVLDPLEQIEDGSTETALSPSASEQAEPGEIDGEMQIELSREILPPDGSRPLSPDEIRRLIERGEDLRIVEGQGGEQDSLGLYITDLIGKLPAETIQQLRELLTSNDHLAVRAWLSAQRGSKLYYYDEWDYKVGDYRRRWCRLTEHEVDGDGGAYFHRALAASGDLIQRVKREFQMLRPERLRKVRGMEDGEDFDLGALVDAHAELRTRRTPSERLYVARRPEERDIATLFLTDMSASTDEPLPAGSAGAEQRRVIDVIKDALVLVAEVLEEVGDAYAIYGFSGHGREQVDYYHVKSFAERLNERVRSRLGGIEPKRSTRMGAALRHSAEKLTAVSARARHLILLSDGFPQDFDYGEDRRSNTYGIQDTMKALQEIERQGIRSFCITVDPGGHDYLRSMCRPARYAVIDDINALPEEVPRIYRAVTRS